MDSKYRREEGLRAVARVTEAIHHLKERDPKFPSQPTRFRQDDKDRIVAERLVSKDRLRNFWEAVIFDRDGYTCQYCHRSQASVWKECRGTAGRSGSSSTTRPPERSAATGTRLKTVGRRVGVATRSRGHCQPRCFKRSWSPWRGAFSPAEETALPAAHSSVV